MDQYNKQCPCHSLGQTMNFPLTHSLTTTSCTALEHTRFQLHAGQQCVCWYTRNKIKRSNQSARGNNELAVYPSQPRMNPPVHIWEINSAEQASASSSSSFSDWRWSVVWYSLIILFIDRCWDRAKGHNMYVWTAQSQTHNHSFKWNRKVTRFLFI